MWIWRWFSGAARRAPLPPHVIVGTETALQAIRTLQAADPALAVTGSAPNLTETAVAPALTLFATPPTESLRFED